MVVDLLAVVQVGERNVLLDIVFVLDVSILVETLAPKRAT
jgi:hypothetical protein